MSALLSWMWKDYPMVGFRFLDSENELMRCHSSSAIESIKNSCRGKSSIGYAYFFFDGTSGQSKLAAHESLVRSIIMQLADQFDGIPSALVELYKEERNGRDQPLIGALENTLLQILRSFDAAYIIVDALDECSERHKVLNWIQSIASKTSGTLHLMITGRPEPDIKKPLCALPNLHEINVASQQESDDIKHYIDARLSEVDKWTEAQKASVRYGLSRGANGVYHHVHVQLEDYEAETCFSLGFDGYLCNLTCWSRAAQVWRRSKHVFDLCLAIWMMHTLRSLNGALALPS